MIGFIRQEASVRKRRDAREIRPRDIETNKSPISKTIDGKVAKPGYHIMNIVAGGATARVFFTVK